MPPRPICPIVHVGIVQYFESRMEGIKHDHTPETAVKYLHLDVDTVQRSPKN